MRVCEARALEVRHGVGFHPDDVVQEPIVQILQRRAQPEDIVIGADRPYRAVRLQHTPAFLEPRPAEAVVGREIVEPVPVVVHPIDASVVRPQKLAAKLKIVGRVGENEVYRARWQASQSLDAIALNDAVPRFKFIGTL